MRRTIPHGTCMDRRRTSQHPRGAIGLSARSGRVRASAPVPNSHARCRATGRSRGVSRVNMARGQWSSWIRVAFSVLTSRRCTQFISRRRDRSLAPPDHRLRLSHHRTQSRRWHPGCGRTRSRRRSNLLGSDSNIQIDILEDARQLEYNLRLLKRERAIFRRRLSEKAWRTHFSQQRPKTEQQASERRRKARSWQARRLFHRGSQ